MGLDQRLGARQSRAELVLGRGGVRPAPGVGCTRPGETPSRGARRGGASSYAAGSPEHEQEPARGIKEEGTWLKLRDGASVACPGRKHRRVTGSEGAGVEGGSPG